MNILKETNLPLLNSHVRCPFNDCYECCLDTKMLLTNSDIQRIENLGYNKNEFCLNPNETDGFWQLKNIEGRCYFLSKNGKCTIYEHRPIGCKVYPLVFELSEEDVIIDEDCREPNWFASQVYEDQQINLVKKTAETLLKEQQ